MTALILRGKDRGDYGHRLRLIYQRIIKILLQLQPKTKLDRWRWMKIKEMERLAWLRCSTDPEASRSFTGFQAQINTSDSWPLSTMALLWGISTSRSTSIISEW